MFSMSPQKFHSHLILLVLPTLLMLFNASSPTNHPPVAGNDSFTVHWCQTVHVTDNDSDPDNDPIFVNGFPTMPAHASVFSNNGNGNIFYCANNSYVGSDS